MIVCNLTKPESTLDVVKKTFPKLSQTDAAQVAVALVLSGRYAQAVYDEVTYTWPEDSNKLATAMLTQLAQIQQSVEVPVKKTKAALAAEEEAVEIKVGLVSNYAVGEQILAEREDLKTLFSDILHKGVEYQYTATDIGWQWALDRVNWHTKSNGEFTRRIKHKTLFQGDATGVEMSVAGTKKRSKKIEADPEVAAEEPAAE